MIKESFKDLIKSKDAEEIYEEFFVGNDVWYFKELLRATDPSKDYDEVKKLLAKKLGLHSNEIAIVGSAKLGFSVTPTPDKMFKDFCDSSDDPKEISDIDIGIVNAELFYKLWQAYFDLSYKGGIPDDMKKYMRKNVFQKFIMINSEIIDHPNLQEWFKKISPCMADLQTIYGISHEVNYRIYESWDAMSRYHINGLHKLKNLFLGDEIAK